MTSIVCPGCQAHYRLPADSPQGRGLKITCPKCAHVFVLMDEPEPFEVIGEEAVDAMYLPEMGRRGWRVRTEAGLAYDFADTQTLRRYLAEGKIDLSDMVSVDGGTWHSLNYLASQVEREADQARRAWRVATWRRWGLRAGIALGALVLVGGLSLGALWSWSIYARGGEDGLAGDADEVAEAEDGFVVELAPQRVSELADVVADLLSDPDLAPVAEQAWVVDTEVEPAPVAEAVPRREREAPARVDDRPPPPAPTLESPAPSPEPVRRRTPPRAVLPPPPPGPDLIAEAEAARRARIEERRRADAEASAAARSETAATVPDVPAEAARVEPEVEREPLAAAPPAAPLPQDPELAERLRAGSVWYRSAMRAIDGGKLEQAREMLIRAVIKVPENPDYWDALAGVQQRLGNEREAAIAARTADELRRLE